MWLLPGLMEQWELKQWFLLFLSYLPSPLSLSLWVVEMLRCLSLSLSTPSLSLTVWPASNPLPLCCAVTVWLLPATVLCPLSSLSAVISVSLDEPSPAASGLPPPLWLSLCLPSPYLSSQISLYWRSYKHLMLWSLLKVMRVLIRRPPERIPRIPPRSQATCRIMCPWELLSSSPLHEFPFGSDY